MAETTPDKESWLDSLLNVIERGVGIYQKVQGQEDSKAVTNTAPQVPQATYNPNWSLGDFTFQPNWYLLAVGGGLLLLFLILKKK